MTLPGETTETVRETQVFFFFGDLVEVKVEVIKIIKMINCIYKILRVHTDDTFDSTFCC